mmetsp:Transcript_47486/g.143721  ORF Transcript_47486/g.143721 Transcript_47486/m.143721 type:complete len:205 (-) Transcript_47486:1415-2029(-)
MSASGSEHDRTTLMGLRLAATTSACSGVKSTTSERGSGSSEGSGDKTDWSAGEGETRGAGTGASIDTSSILLLPPTWENAAPSLAPVATGTLELLECFVTWTLFWSWFCICSVAAIICLSNCASSAFLLASSRCCCLCSSAGSSSVAPAAASTAAASSAAMDAGRLAPLALFSSRLLFAALISFSNAATAARPASCSTAAAAAA